MRITLITEKTKFLYLFILNLRQYVVWSSQTKLHRLNEKRNDILRFL